jgi:hypothetical protein
VAVTKVLGFRGGGRITLVERGGDEGDEEGEFIVERFADDEAKSTVRGSLMTEVAGDDESEDGVECDPLFDETVIF